MAISNEASYYEQVGQPFQRCRLTKASLTTVAGRAFSSWLQTGFPTAGAAPTTAAATANTTAGAWTGPNDNLYDGSGIRRILKLIIDYAPTAAPGGMLTICDRLSHQGGLSAVTTGAQTTNLPTAALTRYTSGVGVMCGLEIYTVIGTTVTTVTTSYTNSAAVSGQVNPLQTFGNTGNREASRIIMMPLVSGDVGVQAVASVTATASTLTAGAFGVTLFYPLVHIPLDDILAIKGTADALYGFGSWFPQLQAGACLFGIYHTAGALTGVIQGDVFISEDR